MKSALPVKSGIALWLLAPGLLWLSSYRPYGASTDRAKQLPTAVPGYSAREEQLLSDRHRSLLGTDDAIYREYVGEAGGRRVWVTCVFHTENWKSIHPPHICLEGSNMAILEDGSTTLDVLGEDVTIGRITTHAYDQNRPYVSCYVYVAPGLRTGSYWDFFWHHLPKAVLRRATSGFLLRVGTYAWEGETVEAAEERCRDVMRELLPLGENML